MAEMMWMFGSTCICKNRFNYIMKLSRSSEEIAPYIQLLRLATTQLDVDIPVLVADRPQFSLYNVNIQCLISLYLDYYTDIINIVPLKICQMWKLPLLTFLQLNASFSIFAVFVENGSLMMRPASLIVAFRRV